MFDAATVYEATSVYSGGTQVSERVGRRSPQRKVVPPRECLGEDGARLRLVAVTDSIYLVDCMCEHMPNWTEEDGVLFNKKGKKIANSESFLGIRREVSELSKVGVQVVWYHVGRAENTHADRLAKAAVPASQ